MGALEEDAKLARDIPGQGMSQRGDNSGRSQGVTPHRSTRIQAHDGVEGERSHGGEAGA